MRRQLIQHHTNVLAALLLFGIFAVCVLAVLLTGAQAYQRLTRRDRAAFDRRSCVQYVATKVRQSDRVGAVRVVGFGDGDALLLGADEPYATWLYCRDGWLMELYCYVDEPLAPEEGERLLEAAEMELSLKDGLLTVRIASAQGTEDTLLLSLRSGEGEAA